MATARSELPPEGSKVRALTHDSPEHDREPQRVTGVLHTRPSPFGGVQCYVGRVQVDPDTVRPLKEDER